MEVSGALKIPSPVQRLARPPRSASTPFTVPTSTKNSGATLSIFSEFGRCLESPYPKEGSSQLEVRPRILPSDQVFP